VISGDDFDFSRNWNAAAAVLLLSSWNQRTAAFELYDQHLTKLTAECLWAVGCWQQRADAKITMLKFDRES